MQKLEMVPVEMVLGTAILLAPNMCGPPGPGSLQDVAGKFRPGTASSESLPYFTK